MECASWGLGRQEMLMRMDGPPWGELNQEVEAGSQEKGPGEVPETESKIVMESTR